MPVRVLKPADHAHTCSPVVALVTIPLMPVRVLKRGATKASFCANITIRNNPFNARKGIETPLSPFLGNIVTVENRE